MKNGKLLFLCTAVLLLAGCAQSPERDIVTQKNTEALISRAAETDENRKPLEENREETPEHYSWNYDNTAGTLHIGADADVVLPESKTIPMYKLNCVGFTQEQVTGLYDYLFQGRKTYRVEGESFTKADCEAQIVQLKRQLEEQEQEPGDDRAYAEEQKQMLQQMLDNMAAQYDSLPEENQAERVEVDATLTDLTQAMLSDTGEVIADVTSGLHCESDEGETMWVNNTPVDSSEWPTFIYERTGRYQYDTNGGMPVTSQEADEKKSKSLPYSYEAARALADGVAQAAGVEARLMETELMEGFTEDTDEERQTIDMDWNGEYTAFLFHYARVVDGTPVAVTSSSYMPGDETALIWPYERISVLVSEAGIQKVEWSAPVSLDETVANDVPVLSFDDAKAVFEELAPLAYEGQMEQRAGGTLDIKRNVHVTQVRLGLMRVKNDGSKRQGLYVPVWLFYGTQESDFHSPDGGGTDWKEVEPAPFIALAVNAVDGTVIDQVEGY